MFSTNLASSLQPNANELELQLKRFKTFSKVSALRTKMLQSANQQQKAKINSLHEVIQRKNREIKALWNRNEHKTEDHDVDSHDSNEEHIQYHDDDVDIRRCLQVLCGLNNELRRFERNFNPQIVDLIGESNVDELVDPHSAFNHKLDKYSQILDSIALGVHSFVADIADLRRYVHDQYIPNTAKYAEWNVDAILLWIRSLENGRYFKYLDVLRVGLKESDIDSGELLPDLQTADLSVTPFHIKSFRDKRDLIRHFRALREGQALDRDQDGRSGHLEERKGTGNGGAESRADRLRLVGRHTNEVVESYMKGDVMQMVETADDGMSVKMKKSRGSFDLETDGADEAYAE